MGNDSILNKYKEGFENLADYINKINNPGTYPEQTIHTGYLVNYNNYQNFENLIKDLQKKKESNKIDEDNLKKIIESKKLTTESLDEVEKQIQHGRSFIIINRGLYELICDQKTKEIHKIKYIIIHDSPGYIIFISGEKDKVKFINNKKNIIDQSTILWEKYNKNKLNNNSINNGNIKLDKWEIIYRDVKDYYKNEIFFENALKNSEIKTFQGFLINKLWIDNW